MFIEPASKLSVPLTVVILTAVKTAPKDMLPALVVILVPFVSAITLDATQMLPDTFVSVN